MRPLLLPLDHLEVDWYEKPKSIEECHQGQVVILRDPRGEWVAHRVVHWQNQRITKGDWSMHMDEQSLIWGQVSRVNGHSLQLLSSTGVSRISTWIYHERPRWVRRLARIYLKFFCFVGKGFTWFKR